MVYINLVDHYKGKCITIIFVMYTFFLRIFRNIMVKVTNYSGFVAFIPDVLNVFGLTCEEHISAFYISHKTITDRITFHMTTSFKNADEKQMSEELLRFILMSLSIFIVGDVCIMTGYICKNTYNESVNTTLCILYTNIISVQLTGHMRCDTDGNTAIRKKETKNRCVNNNFS